MAKGHNKLTTLFGRGARGSDPRHPAEEVRGGDAAAAVQAAAARHRAVGAERRVGRGPGARRRSLKGRRRYEMRCEGRDFDLSRPLSDKDKNCHFRDTTGRPFSHLPQYPHN